MDIRLSDKAATDPAYQAAAAEIRKCVHCGMCLAHCPTHVLWGNELDSPRGRIYQVKTALEQGEPTESLRLHLDRCLTCRACESACPSDVGYGKVAEAGRKLAARLDAPRPLVQRMKRSFVANVVGRPRLFGFLLALIKPFMFVSPAHKRMFSSPRGRPPVPAGTSKGRKFVLFAGCVQRSAGASTNRSLISLFAAAGIDVEMMESRCCGALDLHLGRHERAAKIMRDNVLKVHSRLESGEIEGIVMAASGCCVTLKEYVGHFSGDEVHGGKARLFSSRVRDPAEVLQGEWTELEPKLSKPSERVAFHAPCTLQHGQKIRGVVESLLDRAGYSRVGCESGEICCGAAGSHFILYPEMAAELRQRKLGTLLAEGPSRVLSSNIGCILHLRAGTEVPVSHWVEALAERLH